MGSFSVSSLLPAQVVGSDESPAPSPSPSEGAVAVHLSLQNWALIIVVIAFMIAVLVTMLVYGWPSKTNKRKAKNSVVRAWMAITLVAALVILTMASLDGGDDAVQKILIGAIVAAAGSASAYYFASAAGRDANDAVIRAAGAGTGASAESPLTLSKIPAPAAIPAAQATNATITLYFKVANNGSELLTNVSIFDTLASPPAGNHTWPDPKKPGQLKPGAFVSATAEYSVTQDDTRAGVVRSVATAIGTTPSGSVVQSAADATPTTLT